MEDLSFSNSTRNTRPSALPERDTLIGFIALAGSNELATRIQVHEDR